MDATLTWYGHSAFQIATATCSILIDPFFTGNPTATVKWDAISPPDLVLVTHLHGDHSGDAIAICKKFGSLLGISVGAAATLVEQGLPEDQVLNGIGFNIGGTLAVKGVNVTMTEAFHSADAGICTGFIVTLPDGYTVYHAGDTGVFANMALWGEMYPIDLALLPIGGVFTMDARQAAHAARLLNAKAVVPMHWGTFSVLAPSPDAFAQNLTGIAPACACRIMQPGEVMQLNN